MVVETILRTVRALGSHKAGAIAERQFLSSYGNAHQQSCLLAEDKLAVTVFNR